MHGTGSAQRGEVAARQQYRVSVQEGMLCTAIVVQHSSVQSRGPGTSQLTVVFMPLVACMTVIQHSYEHCSVGFAEVLVHAAGAAANIPSAFDSHSPQWSVIFIAACVLCAPSLALDGVRHDVCCLALHQHGCATGCNTFHCRSHGCQWSRPPMPPCHLRSISPLHANIICTPVFHQGGSCAASPFRAGLADMDVRGLCAVQGREIRECRRHIPSRVAFIRRCERGQRHRSMSSEAV